MCQFVPAHVFQTLQKYGSVKEKSFAIQALYNIRQFLEEMTEPSDALIQDNFLKFNGKSDPIKRSIYDAQNGMQLPGKLVRKEGETASSDVAVKEAYDGSGLTHEFFHKMYNRNSIDDNGMELVSTVHYGRNYGNAFWNGRQMTYGDGDGRIFNRFTAVIDVIGHEISHGVTERTAGLVYQDQPGALNEHFSDVFGSMVKQYSKKQTVKEADWLIGQGLFTNKIRARALRDMAKPGTAYDDPKIGKDPQPDHMDRYFKGSQDNGGVHINSGIPNRAFYTTAMNIGGNSWEKAGKIWYTVLTTKLNRRSQFQDCANATLQAATSLYGANSTEQKAVIDGWKTVGISPK